MNIGEKIRRLRVKYGLTQEELANRSELTKGFISQLERDLTSPSIATLIDILECLGTDLQHFFNEKTEQKIVYRDEDVFVQEKPENGQTISWLVPNAQVNMMEPILVELKPGGQTDVYGPEEGEYFGYVLKGYITVMLDGKAVKAKRGESFYYEANGSHQLVNGGKSEAVVLWVSAPPKF